MLRQILVDQLDDVLTQLVEKPDPDLQALFERLHDVSYAQVVLDDLQEAQAGMAAIFDELGLDVEVPELHADMTEEDAAAAAARLAHELRRAEESRDAAHQQPRHETTARAAEERGRRQEMLRKDSLSAVYRRLAKELIRISSAIRQSVRERAASCRTSPPRTPAAIYTGCFSSKSSGSSRQTVARLVGAATG